MPARAPRKQGDPTTKGASAVTAGGWGGVRRRQHPSPDRSRVSHPTTTSRCPVWKAHGAGTDVQVRVRRLVTPGAINSKQTELDFCQNGTGSGMSLLLEISDLEKPEHSGPAFPTPFAHHLCSSPSAPCGASESHRLARLLIVRVDKRRPGERQAGQAAPHDQAPGSPGFRRSRWTWRAQGEVARP